ncbi:MAG: hypothetical protein ACYC1M_15915 [Armatimonadota bacterium]
MRGEINVLLLGTEPTYSDLFSRAAALYGIGLRLSVGEDIGGFINKLPAKMAPNTVLVIMCDFAKYNSLAQLRGLKGQQKLLRFPVLIFGLNYTQQNCTDCFAAGAAGLFAFTDDVNELAKLLKVIGDYWRMSELPD